MASLKVMNKLKSLVLVTTGASAIFAGICVYKGNEKFYDKLLMPAVRLLPAETSHTLAVWACKNKIFAAPKTKDADILRTNFFNKSISNPIGIAAGFDKQGEAVEGLDKLGFGFIEVGSVTPLPQPGNSSPRVFRLPRDEAIINRYGFNSDGHQIVYKRLIDLREKANFQGVVGVNLGKNKDSPSAKIDYVKGVEIFGPIADYLVVNVSSPNTPGLRNLQAKKDLECLLTSVIDARNNLKTNNKVPILLKISPDLTKQDIQDISDVIKKKQCNVDGLIISNTTISRDNLKSTDLAEEQGGLSGPPLRFRSTQLIADLYYQTGGRIPIIGVGGVFSGQDAFEKIEAGASFIQFYTAFIYNGPPIVSRIKNELSDILNEKGFLNVQQAVGTNYVKYLSK